MSSKFSDEALEKAWSNFQKKFPEKSFKIDEVSREKAFTLARSMYCAIGSNFSRVAGSLSGKQKAELVKQAIYGVIDANNNLRKGIPEQSIVYELAEFICRSVIAQGKKYQPSKASLPTLQKHESSTSQTKSPLIDPYDEYESGWFGRVRDSCKAFSTTPERKAFIEVGEKID